jgi:hypothetical protein
MLFPLLRRAAGRYRDADYQKVMSKVPPLAAADRSNLM